MHDILKQKKSYFMFHRISSNKCRKLLLDLETLSCGTYYMALKGALMQI